MLLLGIDLETGASFGTPPQENFITEVGAVLWDTETNTPVQLLSRLIKLTQPISLDCLDYTGITNEMCEAFGHDPEFVKEELKSLIEKCDFIVAQNGNDFDRPILEAWMGNLLPRKIWLDTKVDVPYPKKCRSNSLVYLNGFHGFCNPYAHRAVFDVCAMLKVLSHYDILTVIDNATSDKVIIGADVTFHDRQLAKDKGFSWENAKGKSYPKKWVKMIKKSDFEKCREEFPFSIHVMEDLGNGQ